MDRQVDHLRVRIGVAEPAGRGPVAARGAVVHDQNTRRAEAYGSVAMTWFTRAVNALIGSHRPITQAQWTSWAAR